MIGILTGLPLAWQIFAFTLSFRIVELFITYFLRLFKSADQLKIDHITQLLHVQQIKLKTLDHKQDFKDYSYCIRTINKLEAILEKTKREAAKNKSYIERHYHTVFTFARFLFYIYITMVHKHTPVYQLPSALLYPVSWIPALPYLPSGSISVVFWLYACNKIVSGIKL